jgi:hypothetical protein
VKAKEQGPRALGEIMKPNAVGPDRTGLHVVCRASHSLFPQRAELLVELNDYLAIDAALTSPAHGALDFVGTKY